MVKKIEEIKKNERKIRRKGNKGAENEYLKGDKGR